MSHSGTVPDRIRKGYRHRSLRESCQTSNGLDSGDLDLVGCYNRGNGWERFPRNVGNRSRYGIGDGYRLSGAQHFAEPTRDLLLERTDPLFGLAECFRQSLGLPLLLFVLACLFG